MTLPRLTPTWGQLARRSAFVGYLWYRQTLRRWWRRHVVTRKLRPGTDYRLALTMALCDRLEAEFEANPDVFTLPPKPEPAFVAEIHPPTSQPIERSLHPFSTSLIDL